MQTLLGSKIALRTCQSSNLKHEKLPMDLFLLHQPGMLQRQILIEANWQARESGTQLAFEQHWPVD